MNAVTFETTKRLPRINAVLSSSATPFSDFAGMELSADEASMIDAYAEHNYHGATPRELARCEQRFCQQFGI